jgi:hypothetical protein
MILGGEEAFITIFKILSQHLFGRSEENYGKECLQYLVFCQDPKKVPSVSGKADISLR